MPRYRKELPVAGEQYAFIAQLDDDQHVVLDIASLAEDEDERALSIGQMAVPLAQLPGLAKALPAVLRDLVEVFVSDAGLGPDLPAETYSDRFEAIRQQYPNAWTPWTEEQKRQLEERFEPSVPLTAHLDQLALEFGRKPSAIRSQLTKQHLLSP